jgi:hypothetical protein
LDSNPHFIEWQRKCVQFVVAFLVKIFGRARNKITEQRIEIGLLKDRIDLRGVVTRSIQTAHNSAHAGSANVIDLDTCLFQHLEHADMCKAFRTTATKAPALPLAVVGFCA